MSSAHTDATPNAPAQTSDLLHGEPLFRRIDRALLLEPKNPSRETFDEIALAELIESIRELGILEPLIVEQEGGKFRIHAGHRRFIAGRAVGLETLPCMVYAPGTAPGSAIQHHENKIREKLNPAQEARYLAGVLERECSGDVDQLCTLVKETRQYVESRLVLLTGWPQVCEALGLDLISLGVAGELNKIDDEPAMLMYLDAATKGGATVRTVRDWRVQWQQTKQFSTSVPPDQPLEGAAVHHPSASTMVCVCCDSEEDAHDFELIFVHKACRRLILDRFLNSLRPQAPEV